MQVRAFRRYADVPAPAWAALRGAEHPFVAPAFFRLLEASGAAVGDAGWAPVPVAAEEEGRLVGLAPAWLKSHSWGEYVFDHPWAEAWSRAGKHYYPKLLVGVPFTPVPGPRLLGERAPLIRALEAVVDQNDLSSAHANFLDEADRAAFAEAGWLLRMGFQFHWENRGYRTFDDFLAALSSHRRKELRRERRQVAAAGVEVRSYRGAAFTPELGRAFYGLYLANAEGKWGQPYLTEAFFTGLGAALGDAAVLVTAERDGEIVAGALHVEGPDGRGGRALYGRNWGAHVYVPALHFELCYHQGIELGITRRLDRVEAGAQGEHKLQRGYLPVATWSAHYIPDRRLREAVAAWLARERAAVEAALAEYGAHSPYAKPG